MRLRWACTTLPRLPAVASIEGASCSMPSSSGALYVAADGRCLNTMPIPMNCWLPSKSGAQLAERDGIIYVTVTRRASMNLPLDSYLQWFPLMI